MLETTSRARGVYMKTLITTAIWVMLSPGLVANVLVFTSPEFLEQGGNQEPISPFLVMVQSDAFADAAPDAPIFLKVTLQDDMVLGDTLVGLNALPVYLSLQLFANGAIPSAQIDAPADSVALVRYIAGESSFWLQINQSSSCWLSLNGAKQGPSPQHPIAFQFGMSGLDSLSFALPLFQSGWANLPSNTRDPEASGSPENAVDTQVLVDLTQGVFDEGSLLTAHLAAFSGATGVVSAANPQDIVEGTPRQVFDQAEVPVGMIHPRTTLPEYDFIVDGTPAILATAGSCEVVGNVGIEVSEAAFPEASAANPVYLRMKLSSDARLCETLVDSNSGAEPIYLAMRLAEVGGPDQLIAPADTASIVRWVGGEEAIWIKLTSPSTSWISAQGQPSGPARFVRFMLGQTGLESSQENQVAFSAGQANLAANTRDLGGGVPVSTEIKVDLSGSSLSPFHPDFWAHVRTFEDSLGVETAQSEYGISFGTSLGYEGSTLLGLLLKGQAPWGGLVINGVPGEIQPGGTCERTGNVGFTVGADLFPTATPNTPVYLKLALPSDTTFCETRVDPANSDPILLALSLENPDSPNEVVAPPDTVSIVRWVAGESAIWLKVTHPTHAWLAGNQPYAAPTEDDRVIFAIGIDGVTSRTLNEQQYQENRANLPTNTRVSQWPGSIQPASTEIKVDISQASMVPDPEPSATWRAYVSLSPSAFEFIPEVETAIDPATIGAGLAYPLSYPGIREIAFTTTLVIDPPLATQGLQVLGMEARPASDVNPVEYKWINAETDVIISTYPSIIFDPIPTETVKVRLEVKDPQGRTSFAEGTLLVNPNAYDLNQDGRNDILDLLFALPDWGDAHNILFLISIPLE